MSKGKQGSSCENLVKIISSRKEAEQISYLVCKYTTWLKEAFVIVEINSGQIL